jgi:flagellar basal-body rod protein FlgB
MTGLVNDTAFNLATRALDGLARRQELIGTNLANVDTPGYQAQTNSFERALQAELRADARPLRLTQTNAAHLAAPHDTRAGFEAAFYREGGSARADGNNVSIDVELMEQAETGLRYQALTQNVSKKLMLMRLIATGR